MEYPDKLYKFLSPERIDILNNKLIRFTQPSALNDPFELQPVFGEIFSDKEMDDMLKIDFKLVEEELNKKLSHLQRRERKKLVKKLVSQAQKNPQTLQEEIKNIIPIIKNEMTNFTPRAKEMFSDALQKIGILSLSEKANHPLLWAHYANSHKGFAIEFNTNHEFFNRRRSDNDELFHLRKVKYIDKLQGDRTLLQINGDDIFATKEISWEYESEWRILAPLKDADVTVDGIDKIFLFSLPLSSISSIIIGALTSDNLYNEIKKILLSVDFSHIELKKARLDHSTRMIHIVKDGLIQS
ncbi:Protein of unknown function [Nitrosomonas marina]|uniref:DUF2971 domain-containing protein n=1 Tax=Nitrosomonas marina TaxID=917 RepID=A0A1I0EHV1_9PROT|nr:DUF2971 domain-containing protein [Nitrosomonas marina]SET43997.1 Protein of unknown function [Nitrosomonas marina]